MQFHGAISQLSSQHNDLADDKLSNTARVCEGGIEDGDAMLGRIVEVDLVGPNAETTDHDQVLGFTEDFLAELGL